jgi:hypothetical protein
MRKLVLIMCICSLCLPVKAQSDNFLSAIYLGNTIGVPCSPWPWQHYGPKKPKKPKIEHLANGNIKVDGKEYEPVIKTSEAK